LLDYFSPFHFDGENQLKDDAIQVTCRPQFVFAVRSALSPSPLIIILPQKSRDFASVEAASEVLYICAWLT
jgi:hypothetical protein